MNNHPSKSTSQTTGVQKKKQWDNTIYSNSAQANRSFTKQQNWEIYMNNKIVKKKIDATMTKPRYPGTPFKIPAGKSSSAINQSMRAKDIQNANQKLAIRLQNVKSTINK